MSGTLDGAGGQNTLDYSAYETAVAVNFNTPAATGALSALSYNRVIGGSATDTLTGPTTDTVWRINDADAGYLVNTGDTVLSFSGIENLTGAATDRDVFIVEQDGSISGTLTGSASGKGGLLV